MWGVGAQGTEVRDSAGNNFSITSPSSAQKPTTALSFLYLGRWENSSGGGNSPRVLACEANNSNNSPYIGWGLYQASSSAISIAYNNGSLQTLSGITCSVNVPICVVVILTMGGLIQGWVNGKLAATGTAASGTINYGATAVIDWGKITGASSTIYSGFGFSLGALWRYALPSRLAQVLSLDPSQFLIFPGDLVAAQLGGISLTAIAADRWAQVDWTALQARDDIDCAEWLSGERADPQGWPEWLAGPRADPPGAAEWLSGPRADPPGAAEWLSGQRADPPGAAEWLSGPRADAVAIAEFLAAAAADARALLEAPGAARADGAAPLEALALLRADAWALVEFLQSALAAVAADASVPLEWRVFWILAAAVTVAAAADYAVALGEIAAFGAAPADGAGFAVTARDTADAAAALSEQA